MTPEQTSQLIDCLHTIGARLEEIADSLGRMSVSLDRLQIDHDYLEEGSTAKTLINTLRALN